MSSTRLHQAGGVTISEVNFQDISPDDIKAWLAYDAIMTADTPLAPFQIGRSALSFLPGHIAVRLFVARDPDGAVAGDGRVIMTREIDDAQSCHVYISIRPDRRRLGIAQAILELLVETAESGHRTNLVGWTTDCGDSGAEFARRLGAMPMEELITLTLPRSQLDSDTIRRWIAEGSARALGYRLINIDGPYPDNLIDKIFHLRKFTQNTPFEITLHEMPVKTVDQMRSVQAWTGDRRERRALAAIYESTGAIAGFTEVSFPRSNPRSVTQGGTVVHPDHRRHGLGKWLKGAILNRVLNELPEIEEIRTSNMKSNSVILAINRTLGFKPWRVATAWQVPAARLHKAGPPETACRSGEGVCK